MKTTCSTALVCCVLGASLLAQTPQTPLPTGTATDPLSAADFLALSNLVEAAAIVWLPDQAEEANQPARWATASTSTAPVSRVQIPYSNGLATAGFTIEPWVNPAHQPSEQAFVFGQCYGRQLVVPPREWGPQRVLLHYQPLG